MGSKSAYYPHRSRKRKYCWLTSYVDDDGITHYSAYFSVTISMRSIDELATDIMGFWSGDLSGIGVSQSEDDTAQEPEDELEEEPTA